MLWAALALVCALPLVWPGDVPFVSDEPNLLAAALRANEAGRPAHVGLYGSFGVPYGPLPTQIYQLLLLVSHDPVVLVALRAALSTIVTAGALLWLSRTLRLTPWFIPVAMLSPYLWHFSRLLWDNTFAIPVGALLFAAYASFLKTQSGRSLVTAVACALALLSIHLMTAPLAAPVGGHMLWRHRRSLWTHRVGVGAVLACMAVSTFGFVVHCIERASVRLSQHDVPQASGAQPASATVETTSPAASSDRPSRAAALLFPLLGGQLLSGDAFFVHWRGFGPAVTRAIDAARWASLVGYALVWAGVGLAAFALWQRRRRLRLSTAPRDTILAIALVALLLQMAQDGAMRVAPYAHYFNGTAAVFVIFAWLAIDHVRPTWLRATGLAAYAAALGGLTVAAAWQVHRDGGQREWYGPTLANQIAVAKAVSDRSDPVVVTDVPHYRKYPNALDTLRALAPARGGSTPPAVPAPRLLVRYRSADPADARVEAVNP